jgi:hypothetical protein
MRRQAAHPNAVVPTDWSPSQAAAVFQMVNLLRDAIWNIYGERIHAFERDDRLPVPSQRASLDENDEPF